MESRVFARWLRSNVLGWFIGFVLVLLLAVIWDTIAGTAQFMTGVGMGAGVGYFQSRVITQWIDLPRPWLWTSVLALTLPFLVWDILGEVGVDSALSLPTCILIGGLLVGVLQAWLLRTRFARRSLWWVPACVVGWGFSAGAVTLGALGLLPAPWGLLSALLLGGVVLGVVTGKTLDWMSNAIGHGRT